VSYQFDWSVIPENWGLFWEGAQMTVYLTVMTMALALVGGLVLALLRLSPSRPVRDATTAFVELFRATPLLLQLYWFFYVLPATFGVGLSPELSALVGLTLNVSAFNSETFRAGIVSIRSGQVDAGLALGMTRAQVMRRVVLPQAVWRVLPPLASTWVSLFKDTSLVSTIAVADLSYNALLVRTRSYRVLEVLTALALMYLVLAYPQAKLTDWLYRTFRVEE
jgi:His/Glu/Gln/Arg/opine family amino acid ABC transporter permease subunit